MKIVIIWLLTQIKYNNYYYKTAANGFFKIKHMGIQKEYLLKVLIVNNHRMI